MRQLFFMVTVFFCIPAYSQVDFQWARSWGGSGSETVLSLATDAAGNAYSMGMFDREIDVDAGPGEYRLTPSGQDMYILKTDASGNFIWAKSIGGTKSVWGVSMRMDKSNNVYITGYFSGTADFNPGTGIANITSSGVYDIFILKLNAKGDYIWAKSIGGTNDERGRSIAADTSGNVFVTGIFTGTLDFDPGTTVANQKSNGKDDIFIIKLNDAGDYQWAKAIGDTNDESLGREIATDASGNVFVTGCYDGTVDFDPGPGVQNQKAGEDSLQTFILKLNPSGNFVWVKSLTGYEQQGVSVATDLSGNVYTTGTYWVTCDFDPGPGVFEMTSVGNDDIYIVKLDANGNFLWAKAIGGGERDFVSSLTVDKTGNSFITGEIAGSTDDVDFDPGAGVHQIKSTGYADIFILKLNTSGNFVWAMRVGDNPSLNEGYGIAVDAKDNIYVCGEYGDTIDADPGPGITYLKSSGDANAFIIKLGPCVPLPGSGEIAGNTYFAAGSIETYSAYIPGSTEYNWTVPAGATILSGQKTSSIQVKFAISSGKISVTPSNSCDNGSAKSITMSVFNSALDDLTNNDSFISPNPFTDNFILQYELAEPGDVRIEITNEAGSVEYIILQPTQVTGGHTISLDAEDCHLSPGIHFVKVVAKDKVTVLKCIYR